MFQMHFSDPWNIISDPNKTFIWEDDAVAFYTRHKYFLAICAILYLPIVFTLQRVMKNREPYKLAGLLKIWNITIALFSIIGTYKLLPTVVGSVFRVGYFETICNSDCYHAWDKPWVPPNEAIWVFYFNISKLPEWIDTLFIVLRKRPLIFLHYYHHIATFLFCWYANQYSPQYHSAGYFFSSMNLAIHSFMYTYYTLCSFGMRPTWNKYLTAAQVLQMVLGIVFLLSLFPCKKFELNLEEPYNLILLVSGLGMYFSYFVLFKNLYSEKYRRPISSPPSTPKTDNNTTTAKGSTSTSTPKPKKE